MQNIMESLSSLEMASILVTFLTISAIPVNSQLSTPCTTSMISSFTPCINYITGSSNNGSSPTTDCCNSLKGLMSASVDCACLVLTANVPFQLPINPNISRFLPQACNMGGLPFGCKASASPLPAPGPTSFPPSPLPVSPLFSPRGPTSFPPSPSPVSPSLSPRGVPTSFPPSPSPVSPSFSPRGPTSFPPSPSPVSPSLSPRGVPTSFPPSPSPVSPSFSPRASKALAATQAPNSTATPQLTPTFPPLKPQLPATHRVRPVRTPSSSSSSSSHKFCVFSSHFFVIFAAIMGFYPH